MWYRKIILAEQGVFNPIGPGGVDLKALIESFFNQSLITDQTGVKHLDFNKINSLVQNSFLKNIISKIELESGTNRLGSYNNRTKVITVDSNPNIQSIQNIISSIQHELVHGTSPIKAKYQEDLKKYNEWKSKNYDPLYNKIDAIYNEKLSLYPKMNSGEITRAEFNARNELLNSESQKLQIELANAEKAKPKVIDPNKITRGRTRYFTDEEINAQTTDLKNAFKQDNIKAVYEKFYNSDKVAFTKDFNKFIATLPLIENVQSQLLGAKNQAYFSQSNINNILQNLPDLRSKYLEALMSGDKSRLDNMENYILNQEQKRIMKLNLPQVDFIDKLENVSGIGIYHILRDIKDPKYFTQIRKSLANDLIEIEQEWGLREKHKPLRSEMPKQKKQNVFVDSAVSDDKTKQNIDSKINSSVIEKQTSKIFGNQVSTPKSKNALSSALPIINKLFKQLSELINKNLDKFNNSKTGKVFNYGMLAKDIYFIVTLADQITKQINAGEEVMMKDQLDLGLTIVSILTDQQTQAILRAIFPPAIVLLNNPQIQTWLVGINIGANVLSGAVSVADQLGTMAGTTNKSEGATVGVQNVPGSAQALVMPVFELSTKYGEVYNALIDIEKGLSVSEAINKHIMKDASGGIEPYRLSLLYKFINNKNKILQYQQSGAFKKLPQANQLLYPSANSAYVISSYKKSKDAQETARKQTRQQSYNRNFAPSGISSIPVQ
jgi:hypothetical protein